MYTPNNFGYNSSHPPHQNLPYLTFNNSHLDELTSIQGSFGNQQAADGHYMPYANQIFGADSTNPYTYKNQGYGEDPTNPYTNQGLIPAQNPYNNQGFAADPTNPYTNQGLIPPQNPYQNQGFAADPTNPITNEALAPPQNPYKSQGFSADPTNQQFPAPTNPYINEGFATGGSSCMNQGLANAASQQGPPQRQQPCSHWTNKPRMHWTKELHQSFLAAVNELGGLYRATPKAILAKMNANVRGVTAAQIKSHLQKARNLDRTKIFDEEYAELQSIPMIAPEPSLFQY